MQAHIYNRPCNPCYRRPIWVINICGFFAYCLENFKHNIVVNLKPNPMKVANAPFDFEFEFKGEIIQVNAALQPPFNNEERGTFTYHSIHPTFVKIYNTNHVRKVYESLTGGGTETRCCPDKLVFTYKLCLASYRQFRKLSMSA